MNWSALRYVMEGVALVVLFLLLLASVLNRAAHGWRCRRVWQEIEMPPPVNGVWIECSEDELMCITRLELVWGIPRSDAARALLYVGGLDEEQDPAQEGYASASQLSSVR